MKPTLLLYSLIFLIGSGSEFAQNEKSDKSDIQKDMTLVYTINSFHNVNKEDANAIAQIFGNHIKRTYKLDYNPVALTLDGIPEIVSKANNSFDCMILTTEEFLKLKDKLPLEPYAINFSNGNAGYKYYLIVNKNSGITDISQLKDETINILAVKGQQAAFLWLEKLLKEKKLPDSKKFFKSIVTDYKATNVLLPVFFNKAKACIITEVSLDLLSELNPSIKKDCRILSTSDYFTLGLCCLNSQKKNTKLYSLLKDILFKLHDEEYGRQLLHLFNADKLVPFKEEYLQNYLELFKMKNE